MSSLKDLFYDVCVQVGYSAQKEWKYVRSA
jgi:hypothetical protein